MPVGRSSKLYRLEVLLFRIAMCIKLFSLAFSKISYATKRRGFQSTRILHRYLLHAWACAGACSMNFVLVYAVQ